MRVLKKFIMNRHTVVRFFSMGYYTFEALRYKENIWKWFLKGEPLIKTGITPDLSPQVIKDKTLSVISFCRNSPFKLLLKVYVMCLILYSIRKFGKTPSDPTRLALRKKCPYSEFFWSSFFRIRTEYGNLLHKSLYSVRMRKNTDQKNSE